MKIFFKRFCFGKDGRANALLILCAAIFIGAGSSEISAQRLPTASRIQTMLRTTVLDFADAIDMEDFSDFRAKSSEDFQVTFTTEQLRTIFQGFIAKKEAVLPVLRNVKGKRARFSRGPLIRTEKGYKILVAEGYFPTLPFRTNFEIEYEWTQGAWKILKIQVKM